VLGWAANLAEKPLRKNIMDKPTFRIPSYNQLIHNHKIFATEFNEKYNVYFSIGCLWCAECRDKHLSALLLYLNFYVCT
jgi:hypothetical protein